MTDKPPTPPGWSCPCSAGRPDWTPDNGPHAQWCPKADEALIEDIEWATGMNGKTLVEQLAEFGLVIRVR